MSQASEGRETGDELRATSYELRAASGEQRAASGGEGATSYELPEAGDRQPTTDNRQPITQHSALSTQHSARALRRRHLWILAPLAIVWSYACLQTIEPFDFWWNVASGRIMFETGRFLGDDVLVYTPVREPYSNPQWGAQLLFYAFYSVSPLLLIVLRAAIMTATYGVLFAICHRRTRSLGWSAFAVLVAFLTGLTNYGMRPQLFAFLPFVLFFWLLDSEDEHPRRLWLLIPIMVFWVNVHGSYFLGWALIGIYAVALVPRFVSARRKDPTGGEGRIGYYVLRIVPLALAGAAAFLNPYGLGIVSYFFAATGDATARNLNIEWQPPTLYNGTGILFFASVAIFLVALLLSRRSIRLGELLLWAAFGFLALLSIRNVIWWGWIAAPSLALSASVATRARLARRQTEAAGEGLEVPLLNWLIAGLLLFAMAAALPFLRPGVSGLAPSTPVDIADALVNTPAENRIFNYMEWGGYLEWRLYPQRQMFIDGRFEARQAQVWDDYLAISRAAHDWPQRLDRYEVRTLALNNDFHAELIAVVAGSGRWEQIYKGAQGTIFVAR